MPRNIKTKDGLLLRNVPDEVTDDEIKTRLQSIREGQVEFDAMEMARNIPSSAVQLAKDISYPIRHPIQTLEGMQSIASGAAQQAAVAGEADPVFADPEAVQSSKAVWDYMKDRYGGIDNLKQSVMDDPVGMMSDLSAVVTGGATLIPKTAGVMGKASSLMKNVGEAVDPLNVAASVGKTAGKGVAELIGNEGLREMYLQSAKFSTTLPREKRGAMAETALKEKIMPTYKGLEKLASVRSGLAEDLANIIEEATQAGVKIPKGKILSRARAAMNKLDQVTQAEYGKVKRQFKNVIDTQGKAWKGIDSMTPAQVQSFKRSLDETINYGAAQKTFGGNFKAGAESARMEMRTAAKEMLESIDPKIAETNERLSRLIELETKGLARSASRIEQNQPVNIQAPLMTGAGTVIGDVAGIPGAGAAAGGALAISQMPKPRAKAAIMFKTLKESPIADMFFDNTGKLTPLGRILVQTGRISQQANQPPNTQPTL